MSDGRDDEALSWAGDDDPTLDPQGVRSAEPHLAPGWKVVGTPGEAEAEAPETVFASEAETSETDPATDRATDPDAAVAVDAAPIADSDVVAPEAVETEAVEPATAAAGSSTAPGAPREQMSSPMLITLGVFGGVFLLYAVGWIVSAFRPDVPPPTDVVGAFMFNLGQALAVLAAPAWMAATLWLTSPQKPWFRIAMLAVGVVVLIPWPFLRGV
ncbi:hypothetical protein [Plantibacter sp. YIM 135249]|uniref:hypothetical protein n=1 Tax=Plantibacter sp. YIM 135249 TaxID=3423918 RepID=UPI003D33B398